MGQTAKDIISRRPVNCIPDYNGGTNLPKSDRGKSVQLSFSRMYKLYICDDRGLRARFNVNLQWHRHKKTLYLGDQLIASLIIMAEVHQKAIEESVPFISMNLQVIHL